MTRDEFVAYRRTVPRPPPLASHTIEAQGQSLAVWTTPRVEGATPLLCVNGGLLHPHDLLWPALSVLAERRQLVFFDQRGRGKSAPPKNPQGATIDHDVSDIVRIRQKLGISVWDLIGHSWGGAIALLAAEQDPEGSRRVITVGAPGPVSDWVRELEDRALARLGPTDRAILSRLGGPSLATGDPAIHSAYARAIYPAWFANPELAAFFSAPRSTSQTGAAVAARLRSEGYDWRARLRALRNPTLVIHGELDVMPVRVAHDLVALLPNAELAVLPGSGHMPFWEAPAPFFARCESFLSAPP